MKIELESDAIVVTIGATGTGKSTFVSEKFEDHDIVAIADIRCQVTGDPTSRAEDAAVRQILLQTIETRAEHGIFTVVDSSGRPDLLDRARVISEQYARPLYAFIFPHLAAEELTHERMGSRMRHLNAYHHQVARINDTDLHSRYTPIVIPKRGRSHIEIGFMDSGNQKYHLDPDYDYVVIPDLHGEWRVLDAYYQRYRDDDSVRFVLLGDLVDRGESSYQTFMLAKKLIEMGKAVAVMSNHDQKLMRYFRQWLDNGDRGKYLALSEFDDIPSYGMKIGHGLEVTLREFYSLDSEVMDAYAKDFVDYYNALPEYVRVETDTRVHYFAHSGINRNLLMGREPKKSDINHVIYAVLPDVTYLTRITEGIVPSKDIWLHVGHDWKYDRYMVHNDERNFLVNHDIGLGKFRSFNYNGLPDFMYVPVKREDVDGYTGQLAALA